MSTWPAKRNETGARDGAVFETLAGAWGEIPLEGRMNGKSWTAFRRIAPQALAQSDKSRSGGSLFPFPRPGERRCLGSPSAEGFSGDELT
jgi:hypothetical protein